MDPPIGNISKLSLQNSVLSLEQLEHTPSTTDGLPVELERDLRILGCDLIQSAGILLKLPQVAMATAQVLLQRFYFVASMKVVSVRDIAMGAIFLSSKVEECPRRIRDIVNVFVWLLSQHKGEPPAVENFNAMCNELKEGLINAELHILVKLGFNVHVQHPHGFMINYLQSLGLAGNDKLAQMAWNYMNDGLRTNIYVLYQPSDIACASIFLAARQCGTVLPTQAEWWTLFDSRLEDLMNIAGTIISLYQFGVKRHLPVTLEGLRKWLRKPRETNRGSDSPAVRQESPRPSDSREFRRRSRTQSRSPSRERREARNRRYSSSSRRRRRYESPRERGRRRPRSRSP
ncbi:Cyclin-L1 [Gaertneriomyces sp. JEL0708]|nr:Cyclin-L1 [Gaertneriomyces sp. JEL0708]